MAPREKIRVAVAGLSGYSGQELAKLLQAHPHFVLAESIGRETDLSSLASKKIELAFLCTPAETSLEMAPVLLEQGMSVVDVSGAFRLKKHSYSEWYGFEHKVSSWLQKAEYGLYPWKKLSSGKGPRLVANPGCFATAVSMALIPLLRSGLVQTDSIVVDAKSGTTGAGRKGDTKLLFSEIAEEFVPYRVGKHQHWPEICETLAEHSGVADAKPMFVTELLPIRRGISAAVFASWNTSAGAPDEAFQKLLSVFKESYQSESDISVGTEAELSQLKNVVNTNRIHFQLSLAYGRPVIFAVIDNLLRGAAGQALMNANQLFGFSAQAGLSFEGTTS